MYEHHAEHMAGVHRLPSVWGEIVAGERRSDFFFAFRFTFMLVLVFWNLSQSVEGGISIKAKGYVQFLLCASGYSLGLEWGLNGI